MREAKRKYIGARLPAIVLFMPLPNTRKGQQTNIINS